MPNGTPLRERTCFLIKPDGVANKVAGKVISRFEGEGFTLVGIKMLQPDKARFESFYSVHKGRPFYEGLMNFMLEGPSIAIVWEAEDAIPRTRAIIGATNSTEAAPGTLRKMYGTDNRRNLVHASDSQESAEREIALLFNKEELAGITAKV